MEAIHTQPDAEQGPGEMPAPNGRGHGLRRTLACAARLVAVLCASAGALAGIAAPSASAAGSTYFVAPGGSDAEECATNSQASPFATIQRAIGCSTSGDTISLAPSGSTPYPGIGTVSDNVDIEAQAHANARDVTVDAGKGELFVSPGAVVNVSGITLSCITNGCESPRGANATNEGTLTLDADTITGNIAPAGGIANITPEKSSTPASLTLEDSTVSENDATIGGGVYSSPGAGATGAVTLTIANSTIADNLAGTTGGGVFVNAGSSATIINSTITGNTAHTKGGGLVGEGVVSLSNTIIAANTLTGGKSTDCSSSKAIDGPGGHNLIGDGYECAGLEDGVNGNQVGSPTNPINPGLATTGEREASVPDLASNGGPTNTIALQTASPAIGTGDPATCEQAPVSDLDQRGEARRSPTRGCDIGAYDSGGSGGIVRARLYVAPSGSDAQTCSADSQASPFLTIQKALSCSADGDTISLAPSGSTPYPGFGTVSDEVDIEAQAHANARDVTVDAGKGELFVSPGAVVNVSGITLSCITNGCESPRGANATNEGTLTLDADTITGNIAPAGGIANITPEKSSTPASLTLEDSTVSENDATIGGGVYSSPGAGATGAVTLTIANSTIADNLAGTTGGGVFVNAGSSATIINSTITGNTAHTKGGGLVGEGVVSLSNTIIAANTLTGGKSTDCSSSKAIDGPGGHNLIGDGYECAGLEDGVNGNQVGSPTNPINPGLATTAEAESTRPALGYYGGATETEVPLAGSPVIGAGDSAGCAGEPVFGSDQRGRSRSAAARGVCDIGADDTGGIAPPTLAGLSPAAVAANRRKVDVTLTGTGFEAGATLTASNPSVVFSRVKVTSATEITAQVSAAVSVPAGSYTVKVSQPESAAICHKCLTVTAPRIGSVTPSSLVAGARRVIVTIEGAGFLGLAKVTFSGPSTGVKGTVLSVSPTALQVEVNVAGSASAGEYSLTVKNGDGSSATLADALSVTSP